MGIYHHPRGACACVCACLWICVFIQISVPWAQRPHSRALSRWHGRTIVAGAPEKAPQSRQSQTRAGGGAGCHPADLPEGGYYRHPCPPPSCHHRVASAAGVVWFYPGTTHRGAGAAPCETSPPSTFSPFSSILSQGETLCTGERHTLQLNVPFFLIAFFVGGRREEGWRRKMRPNRCRYGGEDFWSKTSGFLCSSLWSPTCSLSVWRLRREAWLFVGPGSVLGSFNLDKFGRC